MTSIDSSKISIDSFRKSSIRILAIAFSCFHLYTALFGLMEPMIQRAIHLGFALILTFLVHPSKKKEYKIFDILMIIISLVSILYILINYNYFITRFVYASKLKTIDIICGIFAILAILEATRRVIGLALPITASVFMIYTFFGKYLPGIFYHRGFSLNMFIDYQYMFQDGIFGVPLATSAGFIILFMIFGALMDKTGTGQFFIDFATALTGGFRGGPAKVAIVSSAIMGTISGSAVANVTTTGIFTIPMMKKLGYSSVFAGAVEAVASTGGQLMPPIMGAAAFIMAELTGIPYVKIALHAAIPALLYYLAVFIGVHFEAIKLDLQPIPKDERPNVKEVLLAKGHLMIPLVILVVLLASGYSPMYSALGGIISIILVSSLKKETRMSPKGFLDALEEGGKAAILVALACACAGIIIGVVTLTSLGLKLSSSLLAISGGTLIPALIISMVVGIILGCGLPVSASYVIMAAIVVPALIKLGVSTIAANMFALYFAVLSNITPPVALSAYAAAGISGADPLKTGLTAAKLGLVSFIVPFMFVYSPELLFVGEPISIIQALITSIIGTMCFAAACSNWFIRKNTLIETILLVMAALGLIYSGSFSDVIGIIMLIFVVILQRYRKKVLTIKVSNREIGII